MPISHGTSCSQESCSGRTSRESVALLARLCAHLLGPLARRSAKVYLGALHHLSVPPEKCAMVAAHIYDLRAAASHGMKTVYVRRPTEDTDVRDEVKSKQDGGEVDVVVDSLEELATLLS